MKAVIDTNVFVSGVFWKGPPREVLAAWEKYAFQWAHRRVDSHPKRGNVILTFQSKGTE